MKKTKTKPEKSFRQVKSDKHSNSEILIYQTEDNQTKIDVRMEGETVWLTQGQLAELFQTSKQNISLHISNVFKEGELQEQAVVKEYLTTAADAKGYTVKHYNLDVIISVGYRVKSHRGTQFRIWATKLLREYIVKGFVLDDDRFKSDRSHYFEELLQRIRDIRSSERQFYRKVLDIYATSIDYDPKSEYAQQFFAIAQNKLHWAVVGKTAAEIIADRASAKKPNMGLTSFRGKTPKQNDVTVAKNYLNQDELNVLNRLVAQYLEFAELQAIRRKVMYMKDWEEKLNSFLTSNDMEILNNAGKISHALAEDLAKKEYQEYRKIELSRDRDHIHPDLKEYTSVQSQLDPKLITLEKTEVKNRGKR